MPARGELAGVDAALIVDAPYGGRTLHGDHRSIRYVSAGQRRLVEGLLSCSPVELTGKSCVASQRRTTWLTAHWLWKV